MADNKSRLNELKNKRDAGQLNDENEIKELEQLENDDQEARGQNTPSEGVGSEAQNRGTGQGTA